MLLLCLPLSLAGLASKQARDLHRAINGVRPAVREKDAIHPGPRCQFARERALVGIMKKIGEVNGARGFTADYLHDAGMRMSQRVYGDTAKKIEILFSRGIENVRAPAVGQAYRLARVGGQTELLAVQQARV